MRRRSVLALLGGMVPLTGCTDSQPQTTVPVGETVQLASDRSITVSAVHLRRILFDQTAPDAVAPVATAGSQFVFCTIPVSGTNALAPSPGTFHLILDDTSYAGQSRIAGADIDRGLALSNDVVNPIPPVAAERGLSAGSVGFTIPTNVAPETVAVQWKAEDTVIRWEWDDDLVDALADPPAFSVSEIDHPATFSCGEPFPVSITVTNEGGRTGRFAAILGSTDPIEQQHPRRFRLVVPSGGQAEWDGELEFPPRLLARSDCGDDIESATFELDWALETRTISIDRRQNQK